jgi:hypothetical protein
VSSILAASLGSSHVYTMHFGRVSCVKNDVKVYQGCLLWCSVHEVADNDEL